MKQLSEPIISDPLSLETKAFLSNSSDLVCLSHLRWSCVYQRTQDLLTHGQNRRVFFVEEPVVESIDSWWLEVNQREWNVWVVVPHLPGWVSTGLRAAMHQSLMDELFDQYAIANPILWYYTASALSFTNHLPSSTIVYDRIDDDRIDERTTDQEASPTLRSLDQQLLQRADVVFTGQLQPSQASKVSI